ncbi:uncharacterized protein LOC106165264 isoform X2 [Lingula anatina]|uniref:Uncharacterized protein LOC106165264 isoform X2 n=1 Tax=Lingula anatina TaxID=7574 RepID=A0A2R2MST4_LINAN|nr:uncharacterized protein LOC106165264 isoform X2 [Lingula anatina]|eukprot:XP_023933321.1 uncharacterized protein LOC106165264 isoform X2 [Lingula anatina]
MAGRGRGARMKKLNGGSLEKPRQLKIQQVMTNLREAEQIVYKLSDRKASLQEVSDLCSISKRHGKELETRNESNYLELVFLLPLIRYSTQYVRQLIKDQYLNSQGRGLVMDILEARARKWAGPDHVTQGH